mmetsp:Transcript_24476/g.41761  ORF Transcript_24476/g.41761 Transcript_24476/m.41761 type:complete len:212 (+) Transcript_24476:914-1549(+)
MALPSALRGAVHSPIWLHTHWWVQLRPSCRARRRLVRTHGLHLLVEQQLQPECHVQRWLVRLLVLRLHRLASVRLPPHRQHRRRERRSLPVRGLPTRDGAQLRRELRPAGKVRVGLPRMHRFDRRQLPRRLQRRRRQQLPERVDRLHGLGGFQLPLSRKRRRRVLLRRLRLHRRGTLRQLQSERDHHRRLQLRHPWVHGLRGLELRVRRQH